MVLVRFKKKFRYRGKPVKVGDVVNLKPNEARSLTTWGFTEPQPDPEPEPRRRPAPKPVAEPEPEKVKEPEPEPVVEPEKTEEAEPVEPPEPRRRYRRADLEAED